MTPRALWGWGLVLVSLAVHLVSLTAVRVSLATPPGSAAPARGELIFLGALVAPEGPFPTPPAAEAAAPRGMPAPMMPELPPPTEETAIPPRTLPPALFTTDKQVPHIVTAPIVTPHSTDIPVLIRGPARLRTLQHCPPLAPYLTRVPLTRLRSQAVTPTVELTLQFTVAPEGQVTDVAVIRSSGDPLLDVVGTQYVNDWRFAAVDSKHPQPTDATWGQVTLRVGLEPQS